MSEGLQFFPREQLSSTARVPSRSSLCERLDPTRHSLHHGEVPLLSATTLAHSRCSEADIQREGSGAFIFFFSQ